MAVLVKGEGEAPLRQEMAREEEEEVWGGGGEG